MEIFIIVVLAVGLLVVWQVGHRLIEVLNEINKNINATKNELVNLNSFRAFALSLKNIEYGLGKIALSINPNSTNPESKPESEKKPEWQIENEARKELSSLLGPVTQDEFTEFLANRYHLSIRDPWISKVSKIKISIGLEPAITEIRKRDNNP